MNLSRVICGAALAAISFSSSACDRVIPSENAVSPAALRVSADGLRRGHARVLVDGITDAENLLFTSDGRLFVSGDGGIFEIVQQGGAYQKVTRHGGETCKFGGLVEVNEVIYANCYDLNASSSLFAAQLTAAPVFRAITRLDGYQLANGLTADDEGDLYIGATFQGQILRLRPSASDPFTIASQDVFVASPGVFTDGIKFFAGALWWTNFTEIDKAAITSDRAGRTENLANALTFFDDLYVDEAGILVADALNGTINSYDPRGAFDGATPANTFDGPSAVLPAAGRLGLPASALVITERNSGKVSVLEP
jgi:hypothetical protein